MPNDYYEDKTLKCKDCGRDFIFKDRDQEFFTQKGFSDPTRCWECRQKRKAEKAKSGNY